MAEAAQRDGFIQVRVEGAPYEMGLQHGEQLRGEIRDLLDAVYRHVLYGQPGVVGWGMRRAVRMVTRLMAMRIPLRYRLEMAGIARAADVSYRDLLLVGCFDDMLANLRFVPAVFGQFGCSAFAIAPDRTASGELICGRSLDYFVASAAGDDAWAATDYMKQHIAVIEYAPEDRASFVSVGWPGFVGAATGLSERGIAVSALVVATLRNSPLGVPAPFLYRHILEECDSLQASIDLLRRARRTQGHNVLIGSGEEGDAAVVEYTPWRFHVRPFDQGWVGATNHFAHPEMLRHHPNMVYQSSAERFSRLGELCRREEGVSAGVQLAEQFLLDQQTRSPDSNVYSTILNPCTIYSTLFAPSQRKMWVRVADRPDRQFEEVALRDGEMEGRGDGETQGRGDGGTQRVEGRLSSWERARPEPVEGPAQPAPAGEPGERARRAEGSQAS